jgi:hypothetical protein
VACSETIPLIDEINCSRVSELIVDKIKYEVTINSIATAVDIPKIN